jgi:hypothetical protein
VWRPGNRWGCEDLLGRGGLLLQLSLPFLLCLALRLGLPLRFSAPCGLGLPVRFGLPLRFSAPCGLGLPVRFSLPLRFGLAVRLDLCRAAAFGLGLCCGGLLGGVALRLHKMVARHADGRELSGLARRRVPGTGHGLPGW